MAAKEGNRSNRLSKAKDIRVGKAEILAAGVRVRKHIPRNWKGSSARPIRTPAAKVMSSQRAFQIVYELANDNKVAIDDRDSDSLQQEAKDQQEALDIVHDFIVNNVFR